MATKEEIIERIEIMQAWVGGDEIEWRYTATTGNRWLQVNDPDDLLSPSEFEYRIKPKPREIWAVLYPNGSVDTFAQEEKALRYKGLSSGELVKYREVIGEDNG